MKHNLSFARPYSKIKDPIAWQLPYDETRHALSELEHSLRALNVSDVILALAQLLLQELAEFGASGFDYFLVRFGLQKLIDRDRLSISYLLKRSAIETLSRNFENLIDVF